MGTECHVVAVLEDDADDPTAVAVTLVEHLESRWSRFRADSDISRINGNAGTAVHVDVDTIDAVAIALAASRRRRHRRSRRQRRSSPA